MKLNENPAYAQAGDLVQLVSPTNKIFLIRLTPGGKLQTHRGEIDFDTLIGQPWGSEVYSHTGSAWFLLQPSLHDVLKETKRNTQIMYPKDIGYILIRMGIGPGTRVVEAGTGSGAFTTALAWSVGPSGRVYTYETREAMYNLARKNLTRLGLSDRVTFHLHDIAEGIEEQNVDALFLDLPHPEDYMDQVRQALKMGGYFGAILPTTNQVSRLVATLFQQGFAFTEVTELMMRHYKPVAERLRPTDRMVAHTGYLIFARPMLRQTAQEGEEPASASSEAAQTSASDVEEMDEDLDS